MSSENEPERSDLSGATRPALVRGATAGRSAIDDAEIVELPVEVADGWDERLWHVGPPPGMGGR